MPDPYFSQKTRETELKEIDTESRVTAFINVTGINELVEEEEFDKINKFYHDLSQDIYDTRRNNYSLGLRVIEPEMIVSNSHIRLSAPLFLERELPELSSMTFKLFVDFCNIVLSVSLKNELKVKGIGDIGYNYRGQVFSNNTGRATSEEGMVLSDLLEVFTFDEIFPEGFGQKFIPAVNIPYFYGKDIKESMHRLFSLQELGIFMPSHILDYPASEISVYSDALIETNVEGEDMYICNWRNWMEKHPENYSMIEINENLIALTKSVNGDGGIWKRFLARK